MTFGFLKRSLVRLLLDSLGMLTVEDCAGLGGARPKSRRKYFYACLFYFVKLDTDLAQADCLSIFHPHRCGCACVCKALL
jgi:hypothetical protein